MEISDATLSIPALNTVWKSSPSRIISDHKQVFFCTCTVCAFIIIDEQNFKCYALISSRLKCVVKKDDQAANEESEIEKSLKNITRILSGLETKVKFAPSIRFYV